MTAEERSRWSVRLDRLRLRFRDPALESAYRADRYRHDLGNIRFGFLAGIAIWVAWGLLLRPYMLALSDQRLDVIMRFGVFIPLLLVGLALTFTRSFGRVWEWVAVAIAAATLLLWVFYVSRISTLPAEYGYIGVILITAFTYALLRLRFVLVALITVIGIGAYLPYALTAKYIVDVSLVLAMLYLVSFGVLGGISSYRTERFTRDLFLRERQVEQERTRLLALDEVLGASGKHVGEIGDGGCGVPPVENRIGTLRRGVEIRVLAAEEPVELVEAARHRVEVLG